MRLAKYLANAGVASRRQSELIIAARRVQVDGETVTDPARDVDFTNAVSVDGRPLTPPAIENHVVYAVNKPTGVVSTAKDTHGRPTVVGLVRSEHRLYPVGRLDADTTGLILLTNDGDLAHRLTHPSFEVDKTYVATVARGPVRDSALRALRDGVELEDGRTAPAKVERVAGEANNVLSITIHEGRKRQVKRMCEAVGHRVIRLQRVSFGPLSLGELKPGDFRRLSQPEIDALSAAGRRPGRRGAGGRPQNSGTTTGRPPAGRTPRNPADKPPARPSRGPAERPASRSPRPGGGRPGRPSRKRPE